jgi:hypothetical protein
MNGRSTASNNYPAKSEAHTRAHPLCLAWRFLCFSTQSTAVTVTALPVGVLVHELLDDGSRTVRVALATMLLPISHQLQRCFCHNLVVQPPFGVLAWCRWCWFRSCGGAFADVGLRESFGLALEQALRNAETVMSRANFSMILSCETRGFLIRKFIAASCFLFLAVVLHIAVSPAILLFFFVQSLLCHV